jgi:hypothetical protein
MHHDPSDPHYPFQDPQPSSSTINRSEATQRLNEVVIRERNIQRRFIAPTMVFFAIFAFTYLVIGGWGWWATLIIVFLCIGWGIYAQRNRGVTLTPRQNLRLGLTLFFGFCWIILCNAYFVNWNPHDIPASGLLGGILAATPFLVLARSYRP